MSYSNYAEVLFAVLVNPIEVLNLKIKSTFYKVRFSIHYQPEVKHWYIMVV